MIFNPYLLEPDKLQQICIYMLIIIVDMHTYV